MTGTMIEITRPDGETLPAYLAEPPGRPGAPAVVVLQEWWGLNEQMKRTADRLAEAGYRALVPDLYRGRLAADADEANHLMQGLDWAAACDQDLRGAVDHLHRESDKVAVLGFCMGGALTIMAAVHLAGVDAAVCFYGIPPASAADPARIAAPLLGHFAIHDDWCTPAAVNGLEATLSAGGVQHTLYRYDAHHAFFNEARPEVYHPESAALAWKRTLDFLGKHLGGASSAA